MSEEIEVYYQPIYSLQTGEVECLESLARWEHPELGPISPAKFIPLAEEIGLIDRLCEQVLRRSCRDVSAIYQTLPVEEHFSISVNLSCRQFGQDALSTNIQNILTETGFSPRNLKLEITESVFFEHQERAVAMLDELRAAGIEINIDDFGTGYSNLGYLKKLPITSLKIDRSFVAMIDEEGGNDEIVRAIITLARNLGLTVVAEGIETDAQLALLRKLGCESGQGFLFAEPMPLAELQQFVAKSSLPMLPPIGRDDVSTLTSLQ